MGLTSTGELNISSTNQPESPYQLTATNGRLVTRIGAFAEVVSGKVRTGILEAKQVNVQNKLVVKDVDVSEEIKALKQENNLLKEQITSIKQELEMLKR